MNKYHFVLKALKTLYSIHCCFSSFMLLFSEITSFYIVCLLILVYNFKCICLLNHIGKTDELQTKNIIIFVFICTYVITFLVVFISLYGTELLSTVLSFLPERLFSISFREDVLARNLLSLFCL